MNPHPGDSAFNMSLDALETLRLEASKLGLSAPSYFRSKAAQLIRYMSPRFEVTGEALYTSFKVSVPEHTLDGLQELCADYGVPFDVAGELVATAVSIELPNKH